MTDYLEEFRQGNRRRMTVSLAAKDERMSAEELTEILLGDFADKLGYRRALRHVNAPKELTKMLSKDGEFLYTKCHVYWWDDATADELHAGAKWMAENESGGHAASCFAEHPNVSAKTLKYLYRNCEDEGYLWEALLKNPVTPDDVRDDIQKRGSRDRLREISDQISALKMDAAQIKEAGQEMKL